MEIYDSPDCLVFRSGIIYEGTTRQIWALYPAPLILPAIYKGIDEPDLAFREDVFDPLTRIRRGRFYTVIGGQRSGCFYHTPDVSNGPYGRLPDSRSGDEFKEEGSGRIAYASNVDAARKEMVQLGLEGATTFWRVIDVEKNVHRQQVFTLRARSLFGVLPELSGEVMDKGTRPLDPDTLGQVRKSMDGLIDTYHRMQPVPTVDAARETCRVILASWIGREASGKDLKDVIDLIPKGREVLKRGAYIVNRLHPRAKSSERENQASKRNALREPNDEDAETSVHLVGLVLREIGWGGA